MNNEKLYKYEIISPYTGQCVKEIIGTSSEQSSGKTFIYNKNNNTRETVAIVPQNLMIVIEIHTPKSDSEKALDALKSYSRQ